VESPGYPNKVNKGELCTISIAYSGTLQSRDFHIDTTAGTSTMHWWRVEDAGGTKTYFRGPTRGEAASPEGVAVTASDTLYWQTNGMLDTGVANSRWKVCVSLTGNNRLAFDQVIARSSPQGCLTNAAKDSVNPSSLPRSDALYPPVLHSLLLPLRFGSTCE
jgi:hypothetical protein